MKRFEVRCVIKAPPERVWAVLSDAARLAADGRLGITRLDGTIGPGARLKVWSEVSPGRAFALRVSTFDPPTTMVWTGGMPLGLFTGTRRFTLTPSGADTAFHMEEAFTGPLSGLIGRSIPDLTPSFEKFARGLRELAESR